jgi:hypothetical protein
MIKRLALLETDVSLRLFLLPTYHCLVQFWVIGNVSDSASAALMLAVLRCCAVSNNTDTATAFSPTPLMHVRTAF